MMEGMMAKEWEEYARKQLLYLPNAVKDKQKAREAIGFCKNNAERLSLSKYWTWENVESRTAEQSYRSFVVQGGEDDELFSDLLCSFPSLPLFEGIEMDPVAWVFVGKNMVPGSRMKGRPEHVDDVGASGTVHWQVSGKKIWRLRPCLHAEWPRGSTKPSPCEVIEVECEENSLLLVNTSVYYHETKIPCTQDDADKVSISIAREFHLPLTDQLMVQPRMPICGRLVPPFVSLVSGSFETHHSICAWCRTPTGISTGQKPWQSAACACLCCMMRKQIKRELSYLLNTSANFSPFFTWKCSEGVGGRRTNVAKCVSTLQKDSNGLRKLILQVPRPRLLSSNR
ncbi:hypothetical protein GUITHDRAFT_109119 [Guillardia theta CCMP2712]|uniref:JmjC domain-containing protein n=1 Tax=Guillardia theta (strain CCMP2712) TaxID=905079 RepID=L1JAF3_GUITC|nr:hypothetical protein GUITHDRAFT_109119 [Guillardia theta CCMP2712]EKX45075.1 hypothetical protein GUITHDRAFT_109119 [Guillardia theta CCMP2712]|eukprot:XP_005832055.1 hypothetical protein GUITHDRAFT_109119 [Guillardia theta CCMP2712]